MCGTLRQSALRLYRFGTMKNGGVAMYLAIVLMTLINLSFWYGRREPKTMVFGSWMSTGTTTLTFVKFPASRTWVWSTFMQPLALVVLGISGLPQPVPLASARTTLVKIVPSQGNLLTGYSRCNMEYPAKYSAGSGGATSCGGNGRK